MFKQYEEPEMEVVRLDESLKVACLASHLEDNTEDGWHSLGD